ncbi:MAG: hypothetical protein BGO09_03085 [Bacteroidetes bacterium 47-18]|nr:MAG: hypothetical protein BGO09_03085 [Bacteroidetes bacterium 47-18]
MGKVMKFSTYLVIIFCIVAQSCAINEKDEYLIQVNKSPYCIYQFVYRNTEDIDVISLYWDYNDHPDEEIYDTADLVLALGKLSLEKIDSSLVAIEQVQQSDFDIYSRSDAFTYSVYKNGKIIGKVWRQDDNIYHILKEIVPLVDEEKILCDDFFDLFKESMRIQDYGSKN